MSSQQPKLPALDPRSVEMCAGSNYPTSMKAICEARKKARIGEALGLSNFGVNMVCLPPGCASAHRHWHLTQDEFIYIVEGELTLVTDIGEQVLGPGMVAGFPKGREDGHYLINKTAADASYLEVGDRSPGDFVDYPDVDMRIDHRAPNAKHTRKDGTPFSEEEWK